MSEKLKILFVDDESRVLDGLRRSLRSKRREWQMNFVISGPEALKALEGENFDVIVSDMKMPGMDGAELLGIVRDEFPEVVRIVLSGYADKEMVLASIGNAHQYLSKPCEAEAIVSAVNRAISMHQMLENDNLRNIVKQLRSIPSLPTTYSELTSELQSEYASSRKIGEIISKDPGMTAKVLQLVNSAFFSIRRTVSNPAQAVDLLGTETISSLVLAFGVFSNFEDKKNAKILDHIMNHSLEVANLAKEIGSSLEPDFVAQAFTVGLLHEIGSLILINSYPDEYSELKRKSIEEHIPIEDLEREAFGASHAEIGGYLLSLWGLPLPIVEAVTFHLKPGEHGESQFSCLTALHVSNAICRSHESTVSKELDEHCDADFLHSINQYDNAVHWQTAYMHADEPSTVPA